MKKRFLAILLTLCMMLSLAPAAFAAETDPFTDVAATDWYYDEVVYAYEHGLMQGTSATTFSPDTTTSRAMIVTILYRLENEPAVSAAGTFTDVAAGQYYTEAVEWAYANNIVGGYGNGLFGPTDLLTREQMAAILYRYANYKGYDVSGAADLSGYTDAASISAYALAAMQWANYNGLVNGTSATTLSPDGAATRAQFAVILYRFCENVVEDAEVEEYVVTFEYNYGSKGTYKTVTVEDGETVSKPSNPTRSSYSFSGWYTKASGGDKFDFDTVITADLTLYAHWSYSGGGSSGSTPSHSHTYEYAGDSTHTTCCNETPVACTIDDEGKCTFCQHQFQAVIDETGTGYETAAAALAAVQGIAEVKLMSDIVHEGLILRGDAADVDGGSGDSETDAKDTKTTIDSLTLTGGRLDGFTIEDGLNVDYSTSPAHYDVWSYDIGTLTFKAMTLTDKVYIGDINGGSVEIDSLVFDGATFDMADKTLDAAAHIVSSEGKIGSITFRNCIFVNCDNIQKDIAIDCRTDDDVAITIEGCTFDKAAYNAIQISGDGGTYSGSISISGNTIGETGNRGIRISTVSGSVTITGNTMTNSADTAGEAVKFAISGSGEYSVSGNTLNNSELVLIASDGTMILTSAACIPGDAAIVRGSGTSSDPYITTTTLGDVTITGDSLAGFTIEDGLNVDYTTSPAHYDVWSYDIETLTFKAMTLTDKVYIGDINDGSVEIDSLVFEGVTFDMDGKTLDAAAHIVSSEGNIGSITFRNCIFVNCDNIQKDIAIDCRTDDDVAITIEGCTFDKAAYNAIQISGDGGTYSGSISISGNTIGETGNRGIRISSVSGSVSIKNNMMSNYAADDDGEFFKAGSASSASWTWENNTADGVELALVTSGSDKVGIYAVNGAVREWGMLTYDKDKSFNGDNVVLTVYDADQFEYALTHTNELYDAVKKETGISTNILLYPQTWCLTLGADIDFGMDESSTPIVPFEWKFGRIDGAGCTISHVYISSDQSGTSTNPVKVGLFDNLVNATVSDLNLEDIHVSASGNNAYVGTLTGMSQGDLTSVSVKGFSVTATGSGAYTGGLIGNSAGNKTTCSVEDGIITGGKNVGGFAGYISVETVANILSNCSVSNVSINASNESGRNTIGSFAGRLNEASGSLTLTNCTVNNVTGTDVPTDRIYGDVPGYSVTIDGAEYSNNAT